ncbi:hypothetical protein [Mycobacterium sp. MMS18-G62]
MDSDAVDDGPITPDLLADLQAGLLDDAAAARLRQRIRSEPQAAHTMAALDQVRRDLADLGADEASAPDVPAAVSARIGTALHAASPTPKFHRLALAIGLIAVLLAVVVGAVMLTRGPGPARSAGPTAEKITVSRTPAPMPLSDPQIIQLLSSNPDYGSLADPQRRAACVSSLGYPADTTVLGAQPVDVGGKAGVLILLPADTPKTVLALVVDANCSPAHTGLLAHTVVTRP